MPTIPTPTRAPDASGASGLVAALALAVAACLAGTAGADDTEVFFSRDGDDAANRANLLFMFDTSGSMAWFDDTSESRMARLKKAMIDVVESTEGVNIGIGAFNGSEQGGSILYPATDIDSDVCPDAGCDSIEVLATIREGLDDAQEVTGQGREVLTEVLFQPGNDAGGDARDEISLLGLSQTNGLAGYPESDIVTGLRFTNVDVPRGATVTHASVTFTSVLSLGGDATATFRAQADVDAPQFATVPGNITDRPTTLASAGWDVPDWTTVGTPWQSADLSAVVQEITDREDWCGGNALALIIEGTGLRAAASYENDPWLAPILEITYDPGSVSFTDTCFGARATSRISSSADDVRAATDVAEAENLLATSPDGVDGTLGLRFAALDIPQGATVTDARLQLRSAGRLDPAAPAGDIALEVAAQPADDAARFAPADVDDVTSRTATAATVAWPGVPDAIAGELVESPNLAGIVGDVVARTGWVSGNAMVLTAKAATGGADRRFASFDGDAGGAPRLVVRYRVEGAQLDGGAKVLRTARQDLVDTMRRLPTIGGTPLVDAYYEAANYMLGRPVDFGTERDRQAITTPPTAKNIDSRIYRTSVGSSWTGGALELPSGCTVENLGDPACRDAVITGSPVYVAPGAAGSCRTNQIVLLSDGAATRAASGSRIRTLTGGGACAARDNEFESCGVELSGYLYSNDQEPLRDGEQNLVTHTVGFNISSDFLKDVADAGGGRHETAASARELADAFRNIVTEAADLNTTFVAPSATVSRSNRLANSNDLYFALFKPSTSVKWDGNLKKYQLAKLDGEVRVVDALAMPAIDATTDTFNASSKSLWSAAADGAAVAKGGAASRLGTERRLYTWRTDADGDVENLALHEDTAQITDAMLGLDGTAPDEREALLKWARGIDVDDADGDGYTDDARAQMGDPLHSTPYLLGWDPAVTDAGSLVFVGTNEGFLHAIDTDTGAEKFALVPPKLLPNLKAFRGRGAGTDRPYGLDGSIGAWHDDTDGDLVIDADEKAYLYVGMRRGGRDYYAFDVSDPDSPTLAWTIEGGTGDFVELGQTWSRPVKTRVRVNGAVRNVLVFGAGYDDAHDTKATSDLADTVGRGVYVVDAATGVRLAFLSSATFDDLDHAIPATPRVIDIDLDGLADRIYVGDLGAQLWRFDIDNAADTGALAVTGTVLGDFGSVGTRANRRFHDEPDVALLRDADGREFLSVSIGSGWRAHPLDTVVDDRFHVVRDYAVYDVPRDDDGVVDYPAALTESSLFDATKAGARTDETGKSAKGFYVELEAAGEKVLGTASTVNGQVLFTSYVPGTVDAADACGVAVGGGRLWVLDALTGEAVVDLDGDGSLEAAEDRRVALKTPGIPAPVATMIPEAAKDSPIVLVGFEQPVDALDFGALFRRTFWAETTD